MLWRAMRLAVPVMHAAAPVRPTRPVFWALGAGLLLPGLAIALVWPEQIWLFLAAALASVALLLAFAFPAISCAAWLLLVGLTPDMWLGPLLGPGMGIAIVGWLKAAGLALVLLAMLRHGPAWDGFNPGLAFAAMFAAGMVHGLHPDLSAAESFRTFLGSAAPFAFGFVRLPPAWTHRVIQAVLIIPSASILLGAVLDLAGLRLLFVEGMGLRLQGAGHPAFLGGFALVACYAATLELLRSGQGRYIAWLMVNAVILLLSGARAPLAIGALVIALALLVVPAPNLPWPRRVGLLLGGAMAVASLLAIATLLGEMRLFTLLSGEATHLSGRDEIWPLFHSAWDASPWWGWGVGAGKVIVDAHSPLARLLGTTAAHNEYLRIGVDGGWIGLVLLCLAFLAWAARHMRVVRGPDWGMLLLVLLGFSVHSVTDNTLIATTSSILFAWVCGIFARGAREEELSSLAERA